MIKPLLPLLPILQFNDLAPIDRFQLHEQVQNLVRLRKLHVVAELKRNLPYTPLIHLGGLEEYRAGRRAAAAGGNHDGQGALHGRQRFRVGAVDPRQIERGFHPFAIIECS